MINLSSKQRQYLISLAHDVSPHVYIGKDEVTDNLILACKDDIKKNEILKIKVQQNVLTEKHILAEKMAELTDSTLVTVIGRIIILYKSNNDKKDKINLPK